MRGSAGGEASLYAAGCRASPEQGALAYVNEVGQAEHVQCPGELSQILSLIDELSVIFDYIRFKISNFIIEIFSIRQVVDLIYVFKI
jgi:hypothetical protein